LSQFEVFSIFLIFKALYVVFGGKMMNKFSFFSVSVYSRLCIPVSIWTLRPGQIEQNRTLDFLTQQKPNP